MRKPGKERAGVDPQGIGLSVLGPISNNIGSAVGALAMPALGPVGVVAIRQIVAAIAFSPISWPQWRRFTPRVWATIVLFGAVLGLLSLSIYAAIERIGLGLAVTIEFLGPLAVAVAASRRFGDFLGVAFAAVGVVVLVQPGPTTDLIGIGLALIAAVGWAAYILLNRAIGRSLHGLQGTAAASIVSAVLWLPVTVIWFLHHPPAFWPVVLAVACALLSSVVPYATDVAALRRVPPGLYSTLASLNPVWAALCGLLILGQHLAAHEWIGIAIITASNAFVAVRALRV